jgi:hypothetical protein
VGRHQTERVKFEAVTVDDLAQGNSLSLHGEESLTADRVHRYMGELLWSWQSR